ncbi:MAG TPA: hypothetical protein DIT55_03910 [Spirochaetaceae bacterium]|nr:hypothetical protein [Spirochaetaceae bacterium]
MKKLAFFAFLTVIAFAGCDLAADLTIDDIQGTWNFGSRSIKGDDADNVTLFVTKIDDTTLAVDFWWTVPDADAEAGYLKYEHTSNGTFSGNLFSADSYDSYGTGYGGTTTHGAIEVTFSLDGDQLSAVFSGDGPLNGIELGGGEL